MFHSAALAERERVLAALRQQAPRLQALGIARLSLRVAASGWRVGACRTGAELPEDGNEFVRGNASLTQNAAERADRELVM
jgi:hypothetical protein